VGVFFFLHNSPVLRLERYLLMLILSSRNNKTNLEKKIRELEKEIMELDNKALELKNEAMELKIKELKKETRELKKLNRELHKKLLRMKVLKEKTGQ
jgi:peptidoglycan hydrolase CwlO-like protein